MSYAILQSRQTSMFGSKNPSGGHVVDAVAFRKLLVSHRRMVRADRLADRLRGLQDLDTGEVFLTDERHLLESRR